MLKAPAICDSVEPSHYIDYGYEGILIKHMNKCIGQLGQNVLPYAISQSSCFCLLLKIWGVVYSTSGWGLCIRFVRPSILTNEGARRKKSTFSTGQGCLCALACTSTMSCPHLRCCPIYTHQYFFAGYGTEDHKNF